jgi:hypothetical protein
MAGLRPALWGLAAALVLAVAPAMAATVETLAKVLQIDDVVAVLRDEGIEHGRAIDRDMLDGQGGEWWADQVAAIHDPGRIRAGLVAALAAGMNPDEIDAAIAFFDTAGGQALLAYETAARRAMADPEVEAIARAAYDQQRRNRDARFDAVARFVAVNDLVERNVAGTLGATFHFLRGMSDGGGLDWSEAEILDDVWADEEETRRDTASWIHGFLLMAYRPLDLAELDAYVTFSGTDAGQALNAALFDGFESIYADISHALGAATARAMAASTL